MRTRLIALASLSLVAAGCGSASLGAAGGSPAAATSPATSVAAPSGSASAPPSSGAAVTGSATAAAGGTAGAGGAAGTGSPACRAATPKADGPGSLSGLQFVSADRGWAVGQGAILATTDGGQHWTRQLSGQPGLTGVDFISDQDGWAAGAGTLLATTDGGAHWTPLPAPCPLLRSVHFSSPRDGFAIAGGSDAGAGPAAAGPGGEVLATTDGGHSWRRLAAPANAQSVCFSDQQHGWLGANGLLYRTSDGGADWTALTTAGQPAGSSLPGVMTVECAGDGTAWAESAGPGAAMSQAPHVGYHASQASATALFAEQYFQPSGAKPAARAPGSEPGPFSAISASAAVFVDSCPACGYGTAPWALATNSGTTLTAKGNVGGITDPGAVSFTSAADGWVAGTAGQWDAKGQTRSQQRIVATSDAGRTWRTQYAGPWSAWTG